MGGFKPMALSMGTFTGIRVIREPQPGERLMLYNIEGVNGGHAECEDYPSTLGEANWHVRMADGTSIATIRHGTRAIILNIPIPEIAVSSLAGRRLSDLMDLRGIVRQPRARIRRIEGSRVILVYPLRLTSNIRCVGRVPDALWDAVERGDLMEATMARQAQQLQVAFTMASRKMGGR